MKKIWMIIPAAVVTVGACAAGVSASVYTPSKSIEVYSDLTTFSSTSNSEASADAETDNDIVLQTDLHSDSVERNNAAICDTYEDATCPENVCIDECYDGYADCDNDGVCDTCEDATCPNNVCVGGYGKYYIDSDNDGICDNYTDRACHGNGGGYSGHHGNGHHGGGRIV